MNTPLAVTNRTLRRQFGKPGLNEVVRLGHRGAAGPGRRLPIKRNAAGENQQASQSNGADDCFGQDLRQAMFHGGLTGV